MFLKLLFMKRESSNVHVHMLNNETTLTVNACLLTCIDSSSKDFSFNCIWSSSKSFALDIFIIIFSSHAKQLPCHFLLSIKFRYTTYHPTESSLCWSLEAHAANAPLLPPPLHSVMKDVCYLYQYTASTHAQFVTNCCISFRFCWVCRSWCWRSSRCFPFSNISWTMISERKKQFNHKVTIRTQIVFVNDLLLHLFANMHTSIWGEYKKQFQVQ